ncbi:MAG: hypothetical protein AAFR20_04620 [Pseudomonadota bacterium]
MESIFSDITGVMRGVFLSGDWARIAVISFIAFIGAMTTRNYRHIPGASLFAMVLLAAFGLVSAISNSPAPRNRSTLMDELTAGWSTLMGMTGETLVGYYALFFVCIAILFTARQVFSR